MTHRLFEGKHHALLYHKFRFVPPDEVKDIILQYLDKKKGQPHVLAVDLGCGTGQSTRMLAPFFQQVVGLDISKCQLEEAKAVPGFPNITYREGTAEELSFPDGSVDLLTAASAAHWFDQEQFLAEAGRVLKPRGCMALLGFSDSAMRLHYGDCGDRLTNIYSDVREFLAPYTSSRVTVADNKLEEMFRAIPFPDKERVESIQVSCSISVRALVGFMESWSLFQTYRRQDPQAAQALSHSFQDRLLKEMGVTCPDTEIKLFMEYFCILASKPQ